MASEKENLLARDLNFKGKEKLRYLLTPEIYGNNWKLLAEKMGFSMEQIIYFDTKPEPVVIILDEWCKNKGAEATIKKLLEYLKSMNRFDAVEDLQRILEDMELPCPDSNDCCRTDVRQDMRDEDEQTLTRLSEYDALLTYATKDFKLAEELHSILEGEPYNFKICLDIRDFVAGGDHLSNLATIIEQRVKRVIIILTQNFIDSDECDYQAKFALSLSPGCRERILIPIIYEKDFKLPIIFKHITCLDYTREEIRKFFMERLTRSLGYPSSQSQQSSQSKCVDAPHNEKTETECLQKEEIKTSPSINKKASKNPKVSAKNNNKLNLWIKKGFQPKSEAGKKSC